MTGCSAVGSDPIALAPRASVPASSSTAATVSAPATPPATPPAAAPAPSEAPAAPSGVQDIGRSVKGRPIRLRRFGASDARRRTLVVGGIHGDEYGTKVARELEGYLSSHAPSPDSGIDVIECLNPDGRAAGTRGNAHKVDINRNMPASNWTKRLEPRDSSYSRGCNGGSAAGSEPESKALLAALEGGYGAVIMLHSAGGIVDFDGPGGEDLARSISDVCGLPVQHLGYQPYIHGSVGQYVPEKYGIPVITLELESSSLSSRTRDAILEAAR